MSKATKKRSCPAVGRVISSAECGENRVSRYACLPECAFNTFAPSNYSSLLEMEWALDKKCMDRLDEECSKLGKSLVIPNQSPIVSQTTVVQRLFFEKDEAGLTFGERWERDDFKGLKNDERIVLRAKAQMRIALLEVHQVRDGQSLETVDLFDPEPQPRLIIDRSLASMAARFSTGLAWCYSLPHYTRISGTFIPIAPVGDYEPPEVVAEIVRHLGGPTDVPGMRRWLLEKMPAFFDAWKAVGIARERQTFSLMDAKFGHATYGLLKSFQECRKRLDEVDAVEEDDLLTKERARRFVESRQWTAKGETSASVPNSGKVVLGRVLLGEETWEISAMGGGNFKRLRERFESQMGDHVLFESEEVQDLAAKFLAEMPSFNSALVPPSLLEKPDVIGLSTSVVGKKKLSQGMGALRKEQDQAFLDMPIPVLDNRTPREAAKDPALRPRLIKLLKARVRSIDEENLRTRGSYDNAWMLQELGATEIIFDPPPPREPPADPMKEKEEEDIDLWGDPLSLPLPPPLPEEPLNEREASKRIADGMEPFSDPYEAYDAMDASGSPLLDDIAEIGKGFLNEAELNFFMPTLAQAWLALVPPDTLSPDISFDRMAQEFADSARTLANTLPNDGMEIFGALASDISQPALFAITSLNLSQTFRRAPKKLGLRDISLISMLLLLKVAINEIDLAMRELYQGDNSQN